MSAKLWLLCAVFVWFPDNTCLAETQEVQEAERAQRGDAKTATRASSERDGTRHGKARRLDVRGPIQLPSVRGFANHLRSLSATPTATTKPSPVKSSSPERPTFPLLAAEPAILPGKLVYVRVSRKLLEQNIEREVARDHAVVDTILGASIRGSAHTDGTTSLVLEDNENQGVINVLFAGTIRSRTTGHSGPVVLHNNSVTRFQATKRLVLDAQGLRMLPTSVSANTTSETTGITARVGGLRGRIAERVAWQRASSVRAQADAISSRHAAAQIAARFDKEVAEASSRMEGALLAQRRALPFDFEGMSVAIRYRTTPNYVEIVLHRPQATAEELAIAPPPIEGEPALAIRAHRVAVRRALGGADLQRIMQPLVAGVLYNQNEVKTAERDGISDFCWSPDRNWLMFDHRIPSAAADAEINRQPTARAVAKQMPSAP